LFGKQLGEEKKAGPDNPPWKTMKYEECLKAFSV
jgi:hypothetical protein